MKILKSIFGNVFNTSSEPKLLIESKSPICPLIATVEQDDRVAYLYLWYPEQSNKEMIPCWIRNLKEAPVNEDQKSLKNGQAPMMTKEFCRNPEGGTALKGKDLRVVWLEEGDGVALLENEKLIAVIPCWGGTGGFYGYSNEAIGRGEFAWELGVQNIMHKRVRKADEFWSSWEHEPNPFQVNQPLIIKKYEAYFGSSERYFALNTEEEIPKGLYVLEGAEKLVFATVGVSLIPQPKVEMYHENVNDFNRIELGLMMNTNPKLKTQTIANQISGVVSIPSTHCTFLGEGHTINLNFGNGVPFTVAVVTQKLSCLPKVELEDYRTSKVNFFWLIPITTKERDFAMENKSDLLIEKLQSIGDVIYSMDRDEVV